MGIIDTLEPLQKKCILRRYGYLGQNFSTIRQWAIAIGINNDSFFTYLNKAFKEIESQLSRPPLLQRTIAQLVDDADSFSVEENSSGVMINERRNRFFRLITLHRDGKLCAGSLTLKESYVVNEIVAYYASNKKVPTVKELSHALNLRYKQTTNVLDVLFEDDFTRPRYATREQRIKADSDWYKLIQWTQNNHSNTEEMMQLSALTPKQIAVYKASVELIDDFYPTFDQIRAKAADNGFTIESFETWSQIFKSIWLTINNNKNISKIYELLQREDLANPQSDIDKTKAAVLEKIKRRGSISRGSAGIIADEIGVNVRTVRSVLNRLQNATLSVIA